MKAYYNEVDPYAVQWIRNLIAAGLIADGEVDPRSILDVRPSDLVGFTRCHFFAGIGVWDYALGLAGWPADRPVWTGSCPCQPFSAAGRGAGFADERHLWPAFFHLIRERRPATVLGEQVASKDGLGWLDLVHADLEGEGYAVGAVDLCAAGVGAPHIRQRLYFVADAEEVGRYQGGRYGAAGYRSPELGPSIDCIPNVVANSDGQPWGLPDHARRKGDPEALRRREAGLMGDAGVARGGRHAGAVPGAQGEGAGERGRAGHQPDELVAAGTASSVGLPAGRGCKGFGGQSEHGQLVQAGPAGGFWSNADWIACRDGKARPVEPGTFPLAHGAPARVGRLRAYGNAINAEAAIAFVGAVMEVRP